MDKIDAQTYYEIQQLVHQHAWLIDNHQSSQLADLYVEDGKLVGIGLNHIGRKAIESYGRKRSDMTNRTARHVCTNLRLSRLEANRIEGTLVITLYRNDGLGGSPAPVAIADAFDTYTFCDDGKWRFFERRLQLIFESDRH